MGRPLLGEGVWEESFARGLGGDGGVGWDVIPIGNGDMHSVLPGTVNPERRREGSLRWR
jgi:hypothetical protein